MTRQTKIKTGGNFTVQKGWKKEKQSLDVYNEHKKRVISI